MTSVLSQKRQRLGLRNSARREVDRSRTYEEVNSPETLTLARASVTKLNDYRSRLALLNESILDSIEDEVEALADADASLAIDDELLEASSLLSSKIEDYNSNRERAAAANVTLNETQAHIQVHTENPRGARVQLPKLEISKFSGDPLKFQEFWDSFSTTIHENTNLSTIDKFKYLHSYLDGDAFTTVDGYRLTAENYETVVESLKEKYGNKQLAVFSHFDAMLNLPTASYDTKQLQKTHDECERHIRSLIALGLQEETFEQVFTPIILSKLPLGVKMELHRRNGADQWSLQNLRRFLKDEIRVRAMSSRSFSEKSSTEKPRGDNRRFPHKSTGGTSASLVANSTDQKGNIKCFFCGEGHYSDQCKKFPDLASRRQQLTRNCWRCFSTKHSIADCTRTNKCVHCKSSSHHRSICPKKFRSPAASSNMTVTDQPDTEFDDDISVIQPVNSQLLSQGENVILQTAMTNVSGRNNAPVNSRLLFDTGCSRTLITTKLAKQIGAKEKGQEVVSIAGFSDTKRKSITYKIVEFQVTLLDGSKKTLTANVTPNISCPIQQFAINPDKYPVMKQLTLAEPIPQKTQTVPIDILVGSDYYYDFIGCERIRCSDGLILLSSVLGFIITGRIDSVSRRTNVASSMFVSQLHDMEQVVPQIDKFWSLEDIGVKPQQKDNDDVRAIEMFSKTVRFNDGRYEVDWPWKGEAAELPQNYLLAYNRLKSLLKRLGSDEKIRSQYHQTIVDQQAKGVIEPAPPEPSSDRVHYIPHHCVLTPQKETTKLRIVYDASAKAGKDQNSLNDCLLRGPVLLDDLCGLLIRFRLHKIGLVSDIEKAFLQVGLQDKARDVTRFLWVKDPNLPPTGDNLVVYRFCRVPFGMISSPFLLGGTVQHHLQSSDKPVAKDIDGNMYVDNVVNGKDTVAEAIDYYNESRGLFQEASMNLREWYCNNVEVSKHFEDGCRGKSTSTKVLGLVWNTEADTLSCPSADIPEDGVSTKRQMLKYLAKVFDPCGYFCGVTVVGKMLIQKLWKSSLDWDDKLPDEYLDEWRKFAPDLKSISSCSLKRHIGLDIDDNDSTEWSIHCFCDASAKAYSAVVYLKIESSTKTSVDLIFAKSRVAPVKPMSIPRLELMALLVGTRLISFVAEQLKHPVSHRVVWSDSQCVLHWLSKNNITDIFVKNRVSEIKSHANIEFRYVPTSKNPADIPSRGCTYQGLVQNGLWWHGPTFLQLKQSHWPKNISEKHLVADEGASDVALPVVNKPETPEPILNVTHYSSLSRLLRVTSWVYRFINNCRKRTVSGPLTIDELAKSEEYWVKQTQREHFGDLLNNNKVKIKAPQFKQLGLFTDENGIIRCGGRLRFADIPKSAKHPILLPKYCKFSDLLILQCHQKLLHSGPNHTLSHIRLKYWIVQGRVQVTRVIKKACQFCANRYGGPFRVPPFPPLPSYRVSEQKPFSVVGIDYLGPLLIKTQDNVSKVWICLFCCAAVRAVHLELVENLTAAVFILCLRRFIARYGVPKMLISDNAKQFKSAQSACKKLFNNRTNVDNIQNFAVNQGFEWKFITEYSPWMGGMYERLVQIVKKCLKSSLDSKCVSLCELQTVCAEVGAIVNTRPLVFVSEDISESPITPSHFLGGPTIFLPQFSDRQSTDIVISNTANDLVKNYRRIQNLLNSFWKTWRHQYILSLRGVSENHKQRNASVVEPKIGVVVHIKDSTPRNQWKIGRISELTPSFDGKLRSVKLKLPDGKMTNRPLKLLFPVEMSS